MPKKTHEEHENHERYLVTYADLITLLLGLFVILYASAKVDTLKYIAVSKAMRNFFTGSGKVIDRGGARGGLMPMLPNPSKTGGEEAMTRMEATIAEAIERMAATNGTAAGKAGDGFHLSYSGGDAGTRVGDPFSGIHFFRSGNRLHKIRRSSRAGCRRAVPQNDDAPDTQRRTYRQYADTNDPVSIQLASIHRECHHHGHLPDRTPPYTECAGLGSRIGRVPSRRSERYTGATPEKPPCGFGHSERPRVVS